MPGESIELNFTIMVDRSTVTSLNMGHDRIDDIIILHLENGKDMFVSISGAYQVTCFGVSLTLLARLSQPIRSIQGVRT